MDKISGRRFKFYTRASSSMVTTARESSMSTLPPLLQPNFLDPPDLLDPPKQERPSHSLASKICSRLCQFHERVSKLPCIDRFLSPPTVHIQRLTEGKYMRLVKYRRPKSRRQIQLSRLQLVSQKLARDSPSTVVEDAVDTNRTTSVYSLRKKLPTDDLLLLSNLRNPHVRSRKMYTPEGKVIQYVVPVHSDSSLPYVPRRSCDRMTQVNSESLEKLQIQYEKPNPVTDTGQIIGHPATIVTRPGKIHLPNAIYSDEDELPRVTETVKRVTFWDDPDYLNRNVVKSTHEMELAVEPSFVPSPVNPASQLFCAFAEATPDKARFEDHFRMPENCAQPRRRFKSKSQSPFRQPPVEQSLAIEHRSVSSDQRCPRDGTVKAKPNRRDPPQNVVASRAIPDSWLFDHEIWQRRPKPRAKLKIPDEPVQDKARDLILRYGRFPKVLQMKTLNSPVFGRISPTVSSTSMSSLSSRRKRRETLESTRSEFIAAIGMRTKSNAVPQQHPEPNGTRLLPREKQRPPSVPFLAKEKPRFLANPELYAKDRLAFTKKTATRSDDNWSLANQLLYGYLVGTPEQMATTRLHMLDGRPSSAT